MPLLSIVVPSRDRAETALPCIRHLLGLSGDDFEVIVTDCSIGDALETGVAAIDDPRLTYSRIAPASMSDNFNNGYAHCRGEYVGYIGDDDAFLASGLEAVRRLARDGVEAISSPYRACYFWDNFPDAGVAGRVFLSGMPAGPDGVFDGAPDGSHDARDAMMTNLAGKVGPPLPVVYHGVVARRHLDTVATRTGAAFGSAAPDSFATAALCSVIDRYVVVDRPLTMYGKSGLSNSARLLQKDALLTHRNEFAPQHRGFDVLIPPVESAEAYLADSYIAAFRAMGDEGFIDAFVRGWLGRSYSDSLRRNPARAGAILAYLAGPARRADRRVASFDFAASLIGHTTHRILARAGDRLRQSARTADDVFAVPSYQAAVAKVDGRLS